jgi:hypothetical protein
MLGMKEEEAEREEALAAAQAEINVDGEGLMDDDTGMREEGMERDLDDEIPDADVDAEGLVEEGEEGLEEEDVADEEGYMERDLDDDIPEGYPDDDYEFEEDFDNQPDLDADVPVAEGLSEMERDLDDDVPDAAEDGSEQEGEWQHTDTEEELDDEDENEDEDEIAGARPSENFRTSTPNSRGGLPPPSMRRERETEAQTRFLQRWSGGGDAFDSSSMMFDEDDLRASVTSQTSRRSGLGRRFPRRVGGPRDSLS